MREMEAGPGQQSVSIAAPQQSVGAPQLQQQSAGPRLRDTSKDLLKQLAEELLVLSQQAETAEVRAAVAEARATALQQQLEAAVVAAGPAGYPAAAAAAGQAQAQARAEAAELRAEEEARSAAAGWAEVEKLRADLAAARQQAQDAQQRAEEAAQSALLLQRRVQQVEAEAAQQKAEVEQQQQEQQRREQQQQQRSTQQRPEDVLTLRSKLNAKRQDLKNLEHKLAAEQQQRQQAEQLVQALQGQLEDVREQLQRLQQVQQDEGQQRQQQQDQQRRHPTAAAGQQQQQRRQAAAALAADVIDLEPGEAGAEGRRPGNSLSGSQRRQGHSSEDDETIREAAGDAAAEEDGVLPAPHMGDAAAPAPAAAVVPLRGATAQPLQQQPAKGGVAGQAGGVRPPQQRLPGLRAPLRSSSPGGAQQLQLHRKRPAEGAPLQGAAAAAAAGSGQAQKAGAGVPSSKHRKLDTISPASPGDESMGVAQMLGQGLRSGRKSGGSGGAGAGAGVARGQPPEGALPSPGLDGAGNLLLSLKAAGLGAAQGDEEEEDEESGGGGGRHRRGGRRSAAASAAAAGGGVSGGSVVLKPGESSVQWLNRSAAAFVGQLLKVRDFDVFRQPVSAKKVPGYHDVIKRPMDLGTIHSKASQGRYYSPEQFTSDLRLVVSNAQTYNVNTRHPVHQCATRLMEHLEKPWSFYSKVDKEFRQAELAAVMAEQKEQQEREIEALERELAESVVPGLNVAVYAADDEERNKYYLLRATSRVAKLEADEVDDFGTEGKRGDEMVIGHYYDYWRDSQNRWDKSRRPYYLQDDKVAYVPASALLLVDFEMPSRKQPERSPLDGSEHRIFEVPRELHQVLRSSIKKLTAEPASLLGE